MSTNYANLFGIHNRWAPIVFTVFYFLVFWYYVYSAIRRHSSIYAWLAFFAITRIIAFSLRSDIAHSNSAATNRSLAIAYAVFYNVGFFSLLLSAYNLLHNREKLARINEAVHRKSMLTIRRHLVHLMLLVAAIVGIAGAVLATKGTHAHTGRSLNRAEMWLFFVVALVIAILTLLLIMLERRVYGTGTTRTAGNTGTVGNSGNTGTTGTTGAGIGANHGLHHLILSAIAVLLLLRTLYFAITEHLRKNGQYNEHLWFPLGALPEALIALSFLLAGLVPVVHHLAGRHGEKTGGLNRNTGAMNPSGTHAV